MSVTNWFRSTINQYAPNTRDVEISIAPMVRTEEDGTTTEVGTAVPMLYDIAVNRGLKDQHILQVAQTLFSLDYLNKQPNVEPAAAAAAFLQQLQDEPDAIQTIVQNYIRTQCEAMHALLSQPVADDASDLEKQQWHRSLGKAFKALSPNDKGIFRTPALMKSVYGIGTEGLLSKHGYGKSFAALRDRLYVTESVNADGVEAKQLREKTPFELMFVPVIVRDQKTAQTPELQDYLRREINYTRARHSTLPFETSKLTMSEERFQAMHQHGLKIKPGCECRHTTINVGNGAQYRPLWEDMLHYGNAWLAFFATAISVFTVSAHAPWAMIGLAFATYFINRSGNNFAFYGLAEDTLRELRALFNPEHSPFGKFDLSKAIDATIKVGFVLTLSTIAALSSYSMIMSLGLPATFVNGLSLALQSALPALQTTFAALSGFSAFYMTSVFGLIPIRKEYGLTINDNTIAVEVADVARLPKVKPVHKYAAANQLNQQLHDVQQSLSEQEAVNRTQSESITALAEAWGKTPEQILPMLLDLRQTGNKHVTNAFGRLKEPDNTARQGQALRAS